MDLIEEIKQLENDINQKLDSLTNFEELIPVVKEIKSQKEEYDKENKSLLTYKKYLENLNGLIYDIEQIELNLGSLIYFEELTPVVKEIKSQIGKYDIENKGLLAYKSYLEVLLEYNIKKLNSIVVEKEDNFFDDRSKEIIDKANGLEDEIKNIIDSLYKILPSVAKLEDEEFQKIKAMHKSSLNDSYMYNKAGFYSDNGIDDYVSLSVYGGTNALYKSYVRNLESFKTLDLVNAKKIAVKDQKIKELIDKIKNTLKNGELNEEVEELENNYVSELNKSSVSYAFYKSSNILDVQEELIDKLTLLDKKAEEIKKGNEYKDYLNSVSFINIDLDKLLEIQKYVRETNKFEKEFYDVIYVLVEKEKYVKNKYGIEYNLINNLSKETLIKLEKIFVDRLSLLNREEVIDVIRDYKENGYLNVLDRLVVNELEKEEIREKVTLQHNAGIKYKENFRKLEHQELEKIKGNIIANNKMYAKKMNKSFINNDLIQIDENVFKVPVEKDEKGLFGGVLYAYLYFDKDGRRIDNIPSEMDILGSAGNFYILNQSVRLVDKKTLETVYFEENYCFSIEYNIDYDNKTVIILSKEEVDDHTAEYLYKFNYDGRLLCTCSVKDAISVVEKKENENFTQGYFIINHYQDDIVGLKLITENYEYFYCLFNINTNKALAYAELANFDSNSTENYMILNNMIFNNNRAPVVLEDNPKKLVGYYDKDGTLVIDGKYSNGSTFAGGIAYVTDLDEKTHHLIDINGNNIDCDIDLDDKNYNYYPDVENDRFIIEVRNNNNKSFYFPRNGKYKIRAKHDLVVNSDRQLVSYLIPNELEKESLCRVK